MVTPIGSGKFKVNPIAKNLYPIFVKFSKLAFLIRKNDSTVKQDIRYFKRLGWDIKQFQGKTGYDNKEDDEPGFVAYHKRNNILIVTFRGSDSSVKNPKTKKALDWEVNLDFRMVKTQHGLFHRGFYNKAKASRASLMQILIKFLRKPGPKPKIFFTGHSQGAALAPIAAFF